MRVQRRTQTHYAETQHSSKFSLDISPAGPDQDNRERVIGPSPFPGKPSCQTRNRLVQCRVLRMAGGKHRTVHRLTPVLGFKTTMTDPWEGGKKSQAEGGAGTSSQGLNCRSGRNKQVLQPRPCCREDTGGCKARTRRAVGPAQGR